MADVNLILKADNSQYISKIKEAQTATQKLHDTSVAGEKREKGILEEIDATLVRLQKARQKAFTYEDIEKYNKKIAETKQNLQEYEQAGLKASKTTDTMTQSIGKWVMGLGVAVTVMNALKEAFLKTQQGMMLFAQGTAAVNQVLYNLVTGVGNWNKGVAESIILAKQMEELRRKDRFEMLAAKKLMAEYNELYTEGIDQTITSEEKIKKLTLAKEKYTIALNIEIESTKEQLKLAQDAWRLQPQSDKAQAAVVELVGKLYDLKGQIDQGTRRLVARITGEQLEAIKEQADALTKIHELGTKLGEAFMADETENQKKELDKQTDQVKQFFEDWERETKIDIEKRAELQKEASDKEKKEREADEKSRMDAFVRMGKLAEEEAKRRWDKIEEDAKKQEEIDNKIKDNKIANLEMIANAVGVASDFTLSLYENQFMRLQWQYKKDIKAAGDNAGAKERIDAAYLKKKNELARKAAIAEKISALFSIGINTAVAISKALPNYVLVAFTAAAGEIQAAIVLATPIPKYAKGGWTGNGRERDSTGERVAGIVHEREFVVRKGPAHKFRDVLEAINRDDKKMILHNFNKLSPELLGGTTVNNVIVENDGPNKRLDQVIAEQRKLNSRLSNESIQELGNVRIVRKGQTIRTIRK